MDTSDITYVVFDDERSFRSGEEPGAVIYCRTSNEFTDFVNTEPVIDVLVLDYYLMGESTYDAVSEYAANIDMGSVEAPGSVHIVTSSRIGAVVLSDLLAHLTDVVIDSDGRDLDLVHWA